MQLVLDLIISAVSIVMMACFSWSLRKHFVLPKKMPTGALLILLTGPVTAFVFLYFLWAGNQPIAGLIVGLIIQCAGCALFFAAISATRSARLGYAFDEGTPHGLVTTGPYKYLRHPFYTSYLVFWTGWAISAWSPWAILPLVLYALVYVVAARAEERGFSATPLAHEYDAYRKRTGFLWPRLSGRA